MSEGNVQERAEPRFLARFLPIPKPIQDFLKI